MSDKNMYNNKKLVISMVVMIIFFISTHSFNRPYKLSIDATIIGVVKEKVVVEKIINEMKKSVEKELVLKFM